MKQRSDANREQRLRWTLQSMGRPVAPPEERRRPGHHPRSRQGGRRDPCSRALRCSTSTTRAISSSGSTRPQAICTTAIGSCTTPRSSRPASRRFRSRPICWRPPSTAARSPRRSSRRKPCRSGAFPGSPSRPPRRASIPTAYQLKFQELLGRPVLLAAMVLVAACFSLRFFRMGGVEIMVSGGVAAGFVLYVATKVINDLGEAGFISAVAAGWSPGLVGCLFGVYVLLHQEDG